eukprot:3123220-Rhodomonas_salina.1
MCDGQETGQPVLLKVGRYGAYIQLGVDNPEEGKPKRVSLPPNVGLTDVDADMAVAYLSLPR